MNDGSAGFREPREIARDGRRLLLVFDGGDAPGYASVAVALTEEAVKRGFEVWAATEGFRSLTPDAQSTPRFERLIVGREDRYTLLSKGIPARSMGRRVRDAGSDFRSERYLGFLEATRQDQAAETVLAQGFTHVACVGGNGTFEGARALATRLAGSKGAPVGFVNVSIDNDLSGDRAIGFFSGVEAGATEARGLYEDAYTHKRTYLLEMMGNRSGRHALHCGVAARAHLIVLPFFDLPGDVLAEIAGALAATSHALVVVAEGYAAEARKGTGLSASAHLAAQLAEHGLRDRKDKRVIAEPFSRYLRGVQPAYVDVSTAYLKASLLIDGFDAGRSEIMPYVLATNDVGLRAFADVTREDAVEPALLPLLTRLDLPRFSALARRIAASGVTA